MWRCESTAAKLVALVVALGSGWALAAERARLAQAPLTGELGQKVPPAGRQLDLHQAVELALRQNPELLQAEAEVQAAQARRDGAGLWLQQNPELSGAVGARSREGSQQLEYEIGIAQPVELGGQRGARIDAADALVAAAKARAQSRRIELAARVREAFGSALAAKARLELAEQALKLAEQSERAAQERLAAGAATRMELNAARVESGRAASVVLTARQELLSARAELQLLLGASAAEPLEPAGTLEAVAAAGSADALPTLLQRARERPELLAARAELEAARAEERLAARSAVPTPSVGASVGQEEGAQLVLGTLSFDLPLFNRSQAERGAASARIRQAESVLSALERQVEQEVRLAVSRHDAARAALEVYSSKVVAAADENLRLVNEAYAAGKLDLLGLLLIRRDALEARQGHIDALDALNRAAAGLQRAAGAQPGS